MRGRTTRTMKLQGSTAGLRVMLHPRYAAQISPAYDQTMPEETQVLRPNAVTSRANARVKQLRGAFGGLGRLSGGLVGIEGEHLLEEAVRSGVVLKTVFVREGWAVPDFVPRGVEELRLSEEVFAGVMETRTPQGVAALVVPPVWGMERLMAGVPLIVVAVGLQDPGNLGTLLRSAEAFGASGMVTTPGTVSAWNGKAVRASVGSVFRLPVVSAGVDAVRAMKERGVRVLAAVGEGVGSEVVTEVGQFDLTPGVAILVGNEGAGLGAEWLAIADERVTVPCVGTVESLNAGVAGSVMLYEAMRQRVRVGVRD